jgi:hypothetical protein
LNSDADALSRLPGITSEKDTGNISRESIQSICNSIHVVPYAECFAMSGDVIMDKDMQNSNFKSDFNIILEQ